MVKENEPRTLGRHIVRRVFMRVYLCPPGLTRAVDGAAAADSDILSICSPDQWLHSILAHLLHSRIIAFVLAPQQSCSRIDLQGDATLQHDRSGEIRARGQLHHSAALAG